MVEIEDLPVNLSLGPNQGERKANLEAGQKALPLEVVVLKRSSIDDTKPGGDLTGCHPPRRGPDHQGAAGQPGRIRGLPLSGRIK